MAEHPARPAVFSIPANKSFADALVSGVTRLHGTDPLVLAPPFVATPAQVDRMVDGLRAAIVATASPPESSP